MYIEGKETPKNEKEGVRLLTEAANQNNAFAMKILGSFYEGKKDTKEAEKWYRRAVATGNQKVIDLMKKEGMYPANP